MFRNTAVKMYNSSMLVLLLDLNADYLYPNKP